MPVLGAELAESDHGMAPDSVVDLPVSSRSRKLQDAPDRSPAPICGMSLLMDDDDDWTGTPPEGHYSRDRARPGFWRAQWQASVALGGLMIVIIVVVVVLLLR
jgi:hypothetical protein